MELRQYSLRVVLVTACFVESLSVGESDCLWEEGKTKAKIQKKSSNET